MTHNNNTTNNAAIFNRYFSAAAVRRVNFDALTMDQKITALSEMGLKVDPEKDYKVSKTIKRDSYENAALYAAAVLPFINNNAAKVAEITAILTNDKKGHETTVTAVIKGRNLSKAQTIDVLSRDADIKGGEFEVSNFGGENFVAWCEWLRNLSAEEFENLKK